MTRSESKRMPASRRRGASTVLLFALLVLVSLETCHGMPYKRSTIRLCSKNLSDALHLACRNRGYNEPFLQSGENSPQDVVEPGLADECCYHSCSYTQLEQYCKPMSDKSGSSDSVKDLVWIVNLPYPSERAETSSEERSRSGIDFVGSTIKCKIRGLKGARKKGINNRGDGADCDGKSIAGSGKKHRGRHCRCRRRQQRRRRLGKEKADLAKLQSNEASAVPPVPTDQP